MGFEYLYDIGDIILRALISICFLFIITRLMGKKQISQLTFFDYIIGISIGSIGANMASATDVPYTHTLVSMAVYTAVALIISVVTNKSIHARRFFTGHTFLLIDKGKIIEKNLSKVKYDVNDLLAQARNMGYFDIADIYCALLETNGKISFMPVAEKQPVTTGDILIAKSQEYLTANVIIDGEIMQSNLKAAGLNEEWLKTSLSAQNAKPVSEIILATVTSDNKLKVYEKTNRLIKATCLD